MKHRNKHTHPRPRPALPLDDGLPSMLTVTCEDCGASRHMQTGQVLALAVQYPEGRPCTGPGSHPWDRP